LVSGPGRFLFGSYFWGSEDSCNPYPQVINDLVGTPITNGQKTSSVTPIGLGFKDCHNLIRDVLHYAYPEEEGPHQCSLCNDAYESAVDPFHPIWPPDSAPLWLKGFLDK